MCFFLEGRAVDLVVGASDVCDRIDLIDRAASATPLETLPSKNTASTTRNVFVTVTPRAVIINTFAIPRENLRANSFRPWLCTQTVLSQSIPTPGGGYSDFSPTFPFSPFSRCPEVRVRRPEMQLCVHERALPLSLSFVPSRRTDQE